MKKRLNRLVLLLALILTIIILPSNTRAETDYGDYHASDVRIINRMIEVNGFGFEGEDEWALWERGVDTPPSGWNRVTWSTDVPYRAEVIFIDGLNRLGEGMVELAGLDGLQLFSLTRSLVEGIDASDLPNIRTLMVDHNPQLADLQLSDLPSLEGLICMGCGELNELDLSGTPNLKDLNGMSCNLSELKLDGLGSLENLLVDHNHLTSLDLDHLPALKRLTCGDNNLHHLDLGGLTSLEILSCGWNTVRHLDLVGLTSLRELDCANGFLESVQLNGSASYDSLDLRYNLLDVYGGAEGADIAWDQGSYLFTPQRIEYDLLEGPEPFIDSGERKALIGTEGETFKILRHEGIKVNPIHFDLEGGSPTKIVLNEAYLKTLALGVHHFTLEFEAGYARFALIVKEIQPTESETVTTASTPARTTIATTRQTIARMTAQTPPVSTVSVKTEEVDIPVGQSYNYLPLIALAFGLLLAVVGLRTRKRAG
jgi:hypothetical protein